MWLTVVTFVPEPGRTMSDAEKRALFEATAPHYRAVPGLLRKYFIAGDGRAGGIYEWEGRADAESFHTDAWRDRILAEYGTDLQVTGFDAPCVVDNEQERIKYA